jgi:hypothetical protein
MGRPSNRKSSVVAWTSTIIVDVKRVDLHFKVEVDLEPGENSEKLAEEILRLLRKVYGFRRAEVTNVQEH